jgi:P27 family predicted phage terminase small subunit
MGQRGPAPTPASIHLLNGNPGKRSQAAPGSGPACAVPAAPVWLLDEARAEWDRITPELEKLGLISELDVAHLAAYCNAYAIMARCGRELKRLQGEVDDIVAGPRDPMRGLVDVTPSGYKQISALMQAYNRAADAMKSHAAEFGLSPSARMRVKADGQGSLFPDSDPMEAFFRATGAA